MSSKKNLVPLSRLRSEIEKNGLDMLISDFGYSKAKNKKYFVRLRENDRIVNFGDRRYQDFLIHGDTERRERYLKRHKNDNLTDPNFPGFWSYRVLW